MAEIVELGIRVNADQLAKAEAQFDRTGAAAGRAEKKFDDSGKASRRMNRDLDSSVSSLKRLLAAYISFEGLRGFLSFVVDVNKSFQSMEASLITVTGSAEKAKVAFDALQKFALESPSSLQEIVQGYITLRTRGLQPLQKDMDALNDISGAMGKSIQDIAEGVAQAVTGEYERMKQFGIVFRKEGEQLTATFGGVKTKIGNDARSIQDYLNELAANKFAGGAARQMETLAGAFSNAGDAADQFAKNVGDSGLNAAIIKLVKQFSDMLSQSDGLAESLGKLLTRAVNALSAALEFLHDNWAEIKAIIAAIVAYKLLTWVGNVTTAVMAMNKALMVNPWTALIAGIIAVIAYFGGFQKVILTLQAVWVAFQGVLAKGIVEVVSRVQAMGSAFMATFSHIRDLWEAFSKDLQNFLDNPLQGFDPVNLRAVIQKGFTGAWAEAYKKVRADAAETNKAIDAETDDRLLEISRKIQELDAAKAGGGDISSPTIGAGGLDSLVDANQPKPMDTKNAEEARKIMDDYMRNLRQSVQLAKLTTEEREKESAVLELSNQLKEKGLELSERDAQKVRDLVQQRIEEQKLTQKLEDFSKSLQDATKSSLGAIFRDGAGGFDNMLDTWQDMLYDWAADTITEQWFKPLFDGLAKGLGKSLGSSKGGGGVLNFFSDLIGFADGGDFRVGGVGGVDSQVVAFRATPGEEVMVRHPGKGGSGGGGAYVSVNVINTTGNATARTEERDTPQGKTIDVIFEEMAANAIRRKGSKMNRAIGETFNLNTATTSR